MTVDYKTIVPSKQMEATDTTQYTATLCKTRIDKMTVTNNDTVNRSFSVNLVESGGTASISLRIVKDRVVVPGETYNCPEIVGHGLNPGAFISTIASAAGALTLRVQGSEFT